MKSTLFQTPRCKLIAGLLLSVCFLSGCNQAKAPGTKSDTVQNVGNGDGSVDRNNPLLKDDAPQNSNNAAAIPNLSRDSENKILMKIRLAEACAKDTIVMGYGKDGEVRTTGSDINDYCEGYLLAVYESMLSNDNICRDDPQPPTSYFLRSVFQEHVKSDRALSRGDAQAVTDAYLDAFSCKRPKS